MPTKVFRSFGYRNLLIFRIAYKLVPSTSKILPRKHNSFEEMNEIKYEKNLYCN